MSALDDVEATRVALRVALQQIEGARAAAKTFDRDNYHLPSFAAALLKAAPAGKKKRLGRIFPATNAPEARWKLFIELAKKALNPKDFSDAAAPFKAMLDNAWKKIQETEAAGIKAFEEDCDPSVLRKNPEGGSWQLVARADVAHWADVDSLARTLESLGVAIDLSPEGLVQPDGTKKVVAYILTAAVEDALDVQILHVLARRKKVEEAARKLEEQARALAGELNPGDGLKMVEHHLSDEFKTGRTKA